MDATSNSVVPNRPPDRLLTTAEVALQLQLSERQVARARQAGKLACVRLGGVVRHTQTAVDAYVAACTVDAVV